MLLKLFADLDYAPVSFDNIFFVSSSVVSVIACVRTLYQERDIPEKTDAVPWIEVTEVPEETAVRFELTLRERELVPYIARGLANKQIAAELGISAATVRTHIYNLFQKTGAKSRIELLNILQNR